MISEKNILRLKILIRSKIPSLN